VQDGKGHKDRRTIVPEVLMDLLNGTSAKSALNTRPTWRRSALCKGTSEAEI
jgi:hypothetical protein